MTAQIRRLAAANKAGLTGRDLVLAMMSEADWENQVVQWALMGSWCGVHLRASHVLGKGWAALRGIHVGRHHQHDDSAGLPDWFLWRHGSYLGEEGEGEGEFEFGESFYAELKIWGEKPKPDQVRVIGALRAAGHDVYVWNPLDGDEAKARLLSSPPTIVRKPSGPMSQVGIDVADLVREKQREILDRRVDHWHRQGPA